jgi:hypothetical protein
MTGKTMWRNYAICQVCGMTGAYTLPANTVCLPCWSADAAQRGYTGTIDKDSRWTENKVVSKAQLGSYVHSLPHLILDLAMIIMLLYALSVQHDKISELENNIDLIKRATIFLLEEEVKRSK